MTKPRVGQTAKECDLTTMTVADYLAFYERRGYAYQVGRGTRPALIVVDFSVAFTKGTDKFPGGGYDKEVAATARLLAVARGRIPIFFTTIAYEPHMRDAGLWAAKIPWINGLQTGSLEVAIDERLAPRPDEPIIVKKFASSFFGTGLDDMLKRQAVDTLLIAGCTTSACVRATTVDAMQYGYRATIVADAVNDITEALHAVNLADLRSRYADAATTDELIGYLEGLGRKRAGA